LTARALDFLVIGAQKSGTTTLWHGIDSHPQIVTPGDKERGFFNSDERYEAGVERFIAATFPDATPDQRIGTVTPDYMPASPQALETVAERIRATAPDVRLIALLRDPLERAVSHYRTGLRTGDATLPTFDEHYASVGRVGVRWPPLVRRGEYGRILSRYLDLFDREQLLVLWTDDLEHHPDAVYRQIFAFLGVDPGHRAPRDVRLNVGGTQRRLSPAALGELEEQLDLALWPHVPVDRRTELRRRTHWWLEHLWNTVPDDQATDVGPDLRRHLLEHFARDGRLLRERIGAEPPWLSTYEAELDA
jgi:hypothetical protein